jgi:hypothetical protein
MTMLLFNRQYYGYECAKCGQTSPRQVQHYRRSPNWNATSNSMAAWKVEYAKGFASYHEPPTTSLLEWLVVICECGYGYEMGCADG